MALTPLRIRQFTLNKDQLAKLSSDELNLFFLSGHILNELNSLNKVFAWCLTREAEGETETSLTAQRMQAMIYARILAGKLSEAWEVLGSTWFSKRRSAEINDGLHPDSLAALVALKAYFSRTNLIFKVRNSFAFHYSSNLGEGWEDVAEGINLQIILGGTIGNNLNSAAEIVTNAALIRKAHPSNHEAGLDAFLNDVGAMTVHFTTFLEGVNLVYLRKILGDHFIDQATDLEVNVTHRHSEVRIPYFCAPDEVAGTSTHR